MYISLIFLEKILYPQNKNRVYEKNTIKKKALGDLIRL